MKNKFFVKMFQIPLGGKFVFNDVVFTRGKWCPEKMSYFCQADEKGFSVYLHRSTNVELLTE